MDGKIGSCSNGTWQKRGQKTVMICLNGGSNLIFFHISGHVIGEDAVTLLLISRKDLIILYIQQSAWIQKNRKYILFFGFNIFLHQCIFYETDSRV